MNQENDNADLEIGDLSGKDVESLIRRIDDLERQQRLGLVWRDIPENVETRLRDEMPVLVRQGDLDIEGTDSDQKHHVLIEGDNLHALHVLSATHKNSIDVIYIDPPYNRGGDFRYNDKLIDKENPWRHSAWLSFMEKRLRIAKELLSEKGVLIVSIDSVELARLLLLCNSVFGEKNLIATLAVVNNFKGRSDDKHIATAHEYAVICARDESQVELSGFGLDEERAKEYKFEDEKGPWKPVGLQKTGKESFREDRPNSYYPIYWNEKNNSLSLERVSKNDEEILPLFADGREGRWRWGKDTFLEKKETELLVKRQKRGPIVYVKMRLHDEDGEERTLKPKSLWMDPRYDSGSATRLLKEMLGGKVFDNPKPLEYIKDLLLVSAGKNGKILDFFAGTGTTLHAAAELNKLDGGSRQCILVTNNENEICREVTIPRLKAALTGKWASGDQPTLPGSVAVFTTEFLKRYRSLDRMRTEIARHTTDLISIKDSACKKLHSSKDLSVLLGEKVVVAVAPDLDSDHTKLKAKAEKFAREDDAKIVYVFTWSDFGVEEELSECWTGWEVRPLPAEMLAALRRLAPQPSLFEVEP